MTHGGMNKIISDRLKVFQDILTAIPEVKYVGDTILRAKTSPATLTEGIKIGKLLGKVILKYRKIAGYGRGFAAPQIGISKSVFATYEPDEKIHIFINPVISSKSKTKNYYRELCLSSGIMAADVARPNWVVMSWMDEHGETVEQKFEGFLARLYQHEEAHLRGVVNLDECEPGGIEFCTFDPLKESLRTSR
jgi:peptide deformylase